MVRRPSSISLLLVTELIACAPRPEATPGNSARTGAYKGWGEAFFLEAPAAKTAVTIVPGIGGRVVRFSREGENILFENPDYLGKTLSNSPSHLLAPGYIGYNVDLGPELRGIPKHLHLWVGGYRAASSRNDTVRVESDLDPTVGMRIAKEFTLDEKTGTLRLVQKMTNAADKDQSFCLWDRTLCKGGGFVLVPLNKRSRFAAGWGALVGKRYVGDDPTIEGVHVMDGVLVAKAEGKASKIGTDSDAGWIAYARGRLLLVKYYPYFPDGAYTDGGNSVEVYFDPNVAELEPLSPEVALKPREEYAFPEEWVLVGLAEEVATFEQARALAAKIPTSPFR